MPSLMLLDRVRLAAAIALLIACYCCYRVSIRSNFEQSLSSVIAAPYEAPSPQHQERPGELGNSQITGSSMQRSCLCWEGRCVCEKLVNFASRPLGGTESHPAARTPADASSLPGLDVTKSTTFHLMGKKQVAMRFLDNEDFYGYESEDLASFGSYTVDTRFCCITQWTGTSFSANDGIIGLGFWNTTFSPSIFLTLTRRARPEWGIAHQPSQPLPQPSFTVLAHPTGGELQLGGVDMASVDGPLLWTEMANGSFWGHYDYTPYAIKVVSFRVAHPAGETELLHFNKQPSSTVPPHTAAMLDTGGACTLLPWG